MPGRAARSDQPKSLLYVYITRVFNAGTGLGVHPPSILHETALALVAEIEPGPENPTTSAGAGYLRVRFFKNVLIWAI